MKRLLPFVLVIAAITMGRGIDLPWSQGDHNGWGGAFYSNIARNYLRYGYLETRFAPVISTGVTPLDERRYYLTHPPLLGLALSLSFLFLGEHEWAARLVPLAFSLGSILLLYRFASAIASRETALAAAALFSFAPVQALYGAHVDPQGPAVTFFALLLLLAYQERRPWLGAFALVLGAGFDWPIHYLSGLLALHGVFFQPERRRWAAGLVLGSLALVAAFLLYESLIAPRPEQHYLSSKTTDAFLFWSGIRVSRDRIPGRVLEAPSPREWLLRMGSHLDALYTVPLLALGAFGAAVARTRVLLSLLLLWGLLHVLLFPLGAYEHDYWSIYLLPGLALGGALAIEWIAERLPRWRTLVPAAFTGVLAGGLLLSGVGRVKALPREPVTLGPKLHDLVQRDEGVLFLNPVDARDAYYADCRIRDRVNRVRLLQDALASEGGAYRFFVVPKRTVRERDRKPLFEILRACCRVYSFEEYYLFDLATVTPVLSRTSIREGRKS